MLYCIKWNMGQKSSTSNSVDDNISQGALPRFSALTLTPLETTLVWFICPSVSPADLPQVFCCCNSYSWCPSNIPGHLNPGGFKAAHTSLSSYLLSRRFTGGSGQSDALKASSQRMCRRCTGARDIWPLELFRESEGAPGPVLPGEESHHSARPVTLSTLWWPHVPTHLVTELGTAEASSWRRAHSPWQPLGMPSAAGEGESRKLLWEEETGLQKKERKQHDFADCHVSCFILKSCLSLVPLVTLM